MSIKHVNLFTIFIVLSLSTVSSTSINYGIEPLKSESTVVNSLTVLTGITLEASIRGGAKGYSTKVLGSVESQVAFVSGEINHRPVWYTELDLPDLGLLLLTKEQQEIADGQYSYPKHFEVFIDSTTGRFLEARTVHDGEHEFLFREPTEIEARKQLSKDGEQYHGLPSLAPQITMIDALSVCHGDPLIAKEITISYVLYSFKGSEVIPCWVILLRGLPPFSGSQRIPKITPDQTTMRYVVHAMTGDRVVTTNSPIPLTDKDGNSLLITIEESQRDK